MKPASTTLSAAPASPPAFSAGAKILLLLGNAISLLQAAVLAVIFWRLHLRPWLCVTAALVWLYLVPPLLCRLLALVVPIRSQAIEPGSREFLAWWFALNLQMLFCRFPFLEECLRVIPGCYSTWLRLWGSRIGRLTYWGGGLRILDRQYLRIGDNVTFGAGVRLNPHVLTPDAQGRVVLLLAPITIENDVAVGGYSLFVAGVQIATGQTTRACLVLPPFNRLEAGRRIKPADPNLANWTHSEQLGAPAD